MSLKERLLNRMGFDEGEFNKRCKTMGVSPNVALAICNTESGGDPYAVRYEPHYRWLYRVEPFARRNRITRATERQLQKMSWGPFQTMGALLRELGYPGPLVMMTDPNLNLSWALIHLKNLWNRYPSMEEVAAAYNAGKPRKKLGGEYKNQAHVNRVIESYMELKSG